MRKKNSPENDISIGAASKIAKALLDFSALEDVRRFRRWDVPVPEPSPENPE
jgi:hypothetical protein